MPDANGWPNASECLAKVELITGESVSDALALEVDLLLPAVIAEFQSPAGRGATGGTGREFTPVIATRYFDGNGYPRLRVDDIVTGTITAVRVSGATLADVQLQETRPGLGHNLLVRTGPASAIHSGYGEPGVFRLGSRNIEVVATFGYAATVPLDVREAVRCEVAFRGLTTGVIGLGGIGEVKRQADTEFYQARVSEQTNPVPLLHEQYLACLARYREDGRGRKSRLARVLA